MRYIFFLSILLFLTCAIAPPDLNIGIPKCNHFPEFHTLRNYSPDSTGTIICYYHFSDLDSIVVLHNGRRYSKTCFANGGLEGLAELWHTNGRLKRKVAFSGGNEIFRTRAEYDTSGEALFRWVHKELENKTIYESWYPSGQKHWYIEFLDTFPHGKFQQWREDESLVYDWTFERGSPVFDKSYLYDAKGRKVLRLIQQKLLHQMPKYHKIYKKYAKWNPDLSGNSTLMLSLNLFQKEIFPIIIQSDFSCQELFAELDKAFKSQRFGPLSFSGDESFSIVQLLEFSKWSKTRF